MWITLAEYLHKINEDSRKYFTINENIFQITPEIIPLDFDNIFRNGNSIFKFEIGFGNGESLIKLALKNPEVNYFGIDRKMDRIRTSLSKLNKTDKIPNLVISRLGTDYIEEIVKQGSFDEIIMNFPDPWPKKKQHKNRTINKDFIVILHRLLKNGGVFRFASDHEEYSMEVLEIFQKSDLFSNMYDNFFKNQISDRIETQFEKHKTKEGYKIYHLKFKKI
jgi:tRNA (guanine-N7-)-methyltransferase